MSDSAAQWMQLDLDSADLNRASACCSRVPYVLQVCEENGRRVLKAEEALAGLHYTAPARLDPSADAPVQCCIHIALLYVGNNFFMSAFEFVATDDLALVTCSSWSLPLCSIPKCTFKHQSLDDARQS